MKKILFIFPIIVLLAAGCDSSHQPQEQMSDSSSTPSVLTVVTANPPPEKIITYPQPPTAAQQQVPQFARIWKRYYSARLGFSIEYPSDHFIPLDGLPQGDTYSVGFVNKDLSTGTFASSTSSYIEVDALPTSLFKGMINDDSPYSTTTLDGLTASEGMGEYDAEFVLVYKGTQYKINIWDVPGITGAYYLTAADIEHIRQSFKLN